MASHGLPVRLVLLGFLIAALAASLEAAPRVLLLGGAAPRPGSVLDNSSLGMSLAAAGLAEAGHRVLLGDTLPEELGAGGVAVVVAGPAVCSPETAARVAGLAVEAASRGLRAALLVAASPPYDSCLAVFEALGSPPPVTGQAGGVYLAAGRLEAGPLLMALVDPAEALEGGGWRAAVWAVGEGGERLPGLLVSERGGVVLVYIPDWKAFTNALVEASRRAGFDQAEALRVIVESTAGPGAVVLQPASPYPAPPRAGVAFQPGVALAKLLEAYASVEAALLSRVARSPPAWLAFTWTVSLVAATLALIALGGSREEAREQPLLPVRVGRRWRRGRG